MSDKSSGGRYLAALTLSALGVVYGDIGTSPLYALRECFHTEAVGRGHAVLPTPENVLGVLSLIAWSLIIIVSIKYLALVMRADNRGEGGILALLALAFPDRSSATKGYRAVLISLGVFGAALLYGDGMITPAISVLSAIEGLSVATPMFNDCIVPITVCILVLLFAIQRHGTGHMGRIFGPVMVVWFAAIALMGIAGICRDPRVLLAVNPWHGIHFLLENGPTGFVVLGAVFLVVTGGEALYADMGHFGIRPIRIAWFSVVIPALLLNYLGQGALIMKDPLAVENPFYLLAPKWALYPLVALATAATVIASQALISGAFSLTMQAVQLGYLPRFSIKHTSFEERGQVYLPHVNWFLMVACIGLVLGFKTSSNLAAAYGIAVTMTMIITTMLFYFASRRLWHWSVLKAASVCSLFLVIEMSFFAANLVKVFHGGWFPLAIGAAIFTIMATWKTGRSVLWQRLQASTLPREMFLEDVQANPPKRVPGTAVFLAGNPNGTPVALLHNLKHNKILHDRNVLLTVVTDDVPQVDRINRVQVEKLPAGFFRVLCHYGFMEEPDIQSVLRECEFDGQKINMNKTTFFLSRETIIPTETKSMSRWRKMLFAILSRNAMSATGFFQLPANRVVELGTQVEL